MLEAMESLAAPARGLFGARLLALAFLCLIALCLAASSVPAPEPGPKLLKASIFSRDNPQTLLYTFKRVAEQSNSIVKVQREYEDPMGKLAARETVFYEGASLKAFYFEDLQTGAHGSAVVEPDSKSHVRSFLVFRYARNASDLAASEFRREPWTEDTLVNDTVGVFLAAHWEQLDSGRTVRCKYVVVPRRETVGFSFKKESESTWRGRGVIILKMLPTNPLLSAFVDPLYFTVEKAPPHRVLQYVGRTTPKILDHGRWKDLDALTVFDWSRTAD